MKRFNITYNISFTNRLKRKEKRNINEERYISFPSLILSLRSLPMSLPCRIKLYRYLNNINFSSPTSSHIHHFPYYYFTIHVSSKPFLLLLPPPPPPPPPPLLAL